MQTYLIKTDKRSDRIGFLYVLVSALAVVSTWTIHEFAHFLQGNFLGYDMVMTPNTSYPVSGAYTKPRDLQIISAAGPIITILEAIVIFFIMAQRNRKFLYPFLLTCFYMRLLATVISFMNPNDEARISKELGIGSFTIPVLVSLLLFFMVFKTSQKYKFSNKFNLISLGLIIIFSSVIILFDQFFKIRIL